jgi:hypothetical protein
MSEEEQKKLVELLKNVPAGFLPFEVFMEIARLAVLPIIEFVPLRYVDNQIQVLLMRREKDDNLWPNELHTPGTVIRPTDLDSTEHLAFKRIMEEELKGVELSAPVYVGSNLHKSRRGAEQAQIFWVEVLNEPSIGEFHSIDKLPEEVMQSQIGFIKLAVNDFEKTKRNNDDKN